MVKKEVTTATVSYLSDLLPGSKRFDDLFREGMALVEETAAYLDGPGRQASKKLGRSASLAYATESMRLTTRLMQGASWLLLHRAVKEREMTLEQSRNDKKKIKLIVSNGDDEANYKLLPLRLQELVVKSKLLLREIIRMDVRLYMMLLPDAPQRLNEPLELLRRLQQEFEWE